ncbi:MAG: beta-propeller fold lactonase family protein [Elusimicrobia bacterium]|nr:beta-propeller fold lactonase family protein [Elusimicrobiota bacterium]
MNRISSIVFRTLPLLMSLVLIAVDGQAAESRLRAYVTNFEGEKISVIDVEGRKEIAQITTGQKPHGVAIAPDGSEVFVTNEGDGTLSFIDPKENKVTATIKVGARPQQPALSQDGATLYVPLNADHAVAIVDVKRREVASVLPVGRNPHIVLASPASKRIYITCEGDEKIVVVDTETKQVVKSIPIWAWPRVPAVTPDGKRLFQTIRWTNGALVIDLDKDKVVDRIGLAEPKGFPKDGMVAHGLRVTPDGKELWLTTQLNDRITIIDPSTLKTIASLGAGRNPNWIEFTQDGKIAVVSNTSSNDVSLIDRRKRSLIKTIPVVKAPKRLAVGYVKTEGE